MRILRVVPLALLSGCLHLFGSTEAKPVSARAVIPREFKSPVRVHLVDGATVVFRTGVIIRQEGITGSGLRYGLLSPSATEQALVPFDSVAAMVVFEGGRSGTFRSIAMNLLANLFLPLGVSIILIFLDLSGME